MIFCNLHYLQQLSCHYAVVTQTHTHKDKQLIKHSYFRISTPCGFEVALFQHLEYVKLHVTHCPLLVMLGLCSQQVHVI